MTTRRDFLRHGAAAAGAIAFKGFPCLTALAGPGATFFAWHNKTLDEHIHLRDTYSKLGYRFRSVSIYGDGNANSSYFAAVMIKRPVVVAQRDWPLVAATELQGLFDAQAKDNFGPVILAACGSAGSPTFSAVFEPQKPIPLVRVGIGLGRHLRFQDHPGNELASQAAGPHDELGRILRGCQPPFVRSHLDAKPG